MSKKVYELAKELEMESKELLEKVNSMGIEAKSHNSVLTDIDAKSITNMILHSRTKTTETKIVKAPPKGRASTEKDDDVKISVKAATIATKMAREKPDTKEKPTAKATQSRSMDSGKDIASAKTSSGATQPPTGVPLPKSASVQPPTGIPLPKSASQQIPIGVPLSKAETLQNIAEEKIAEQDSSVKETKNIKMEEEKAINKDVEENVENTVISSLPRGLVIKKRAVDIAAEKAEKDRIAKEKQEKAAAERAKREKEKEAEIKNRKSTAKPEKSEKFEGRPKKQSEDKPAAGGGFRKYESKDKDGASDKKEFRGKRQDERQAPKKRDGSQSGQVRDEAISTPARQRKAAPADIVAKKEKDKKPGGQDFQDKIGKKNYRKKAEPLPASMEKRAPKKYKKKVEKPVVEEVSNIDIETLTPGSRVINVPITVKGLSEQIDKSTSEIIMALMKLGIMANVNQNLDEDTAVLLGSELGVNIVVDKIEEEVIEEGIETFEDKDSDLKSRPPIITVMGHVDHGKTSLLDAIRKTNVTTTESGGITQHIGASEVTVNDQRIVLLDTPGHEAFTAMRARGAHVTDIAILVVAADDSVKPQTIESISHAKAAGIPIIVAINKIDKPEANPDRVKQDLANLPADQRVLVEEWGGDTICVPVSAKTGDGIHNLLEMVLLQAEILELKANPNRLAMGTVIEARLDKAKGPVATLLVLNGTLQVGMPVVAGTSCGKIRAMTNFKGDSIRKAGPATAVEILGLNDVPEAGDEFNAVKEDRIAREIAEQRRLKVREEIMVRDSSTTLDQLFSQIKEGEVKELNLIIKADVQGSVGALIASLEKLHTENVKVRIIHSGVGTITESDIMLATTSDAIIIGFNVRPSTNITMMAEHENIEIRTYRVIYDAIDDIEAAMKGMLDPIYKEVILGKVEIRNTFKVPGVGVVGGAYVLEGKVLRNAGVRLVRDGIVIHEGKISSLKRFKDDAKEVNQGYECGIGIENYNDIKEGDIIEAFKMEEIAR